MQAEINRWQAVAPERLGLAVKAALDGAALLTLWRVEAATDKGLRRLTVQPIAVGADGTQLPALERRCSQLLRAEPSLPRWSADQRLQCCGRRDESVMTRPA